MYLHTLGASGSTHRPEQGWSSRGSRIGEPAAGTRRTCWATGRGYAGFDSPPPPSTPERSTTIDTHKVWQSVVAKYDNKFWNTQPGRDMLVLAYMQVGSQTQVAVAFGCNIARVNDALYWYGIRPIDIK